MWRYYISKVQAYSMLNLAFVNQLTTEFWVYGPFNVLSNFAAILYKFVTWTILVSINKLTIVRFFWPMTSLPEMWPLQEQRNIYWANSCKGRENWSTQCCPSPFAARYSSSRNMYFSLIRWTHPQHTLVISGLLISQYAPFLWLYLAS